LKPLDPSLVAIQYNIIHDLLRPKITQKKIWKQHISTKLDKGYRLLYKLSFLVEEKFWHIFAQKGTLTKKEVEIFFSTRYDNLYTNRKPLSSLVEICCFKIFLSDFWPKKSPPVQQASPPVVLGVTDPSLDHDPLMS
jgi:hypothetical protein